MAEACHHVADLHDRMPVIFKRADWADWLDEPRCGSGLLCRPSELMMVLGTADSW